MKNSRVSIRTLGLITVLVGLGGCATPSRETYQPLQNGYAIRTYYHRSPLMEKPTTRSELEFHGQDGMKVVWPFVDDVVVKDELAVFVGFLHNESGFNGKHLFAYQPSGRTADITAQVLRLTAKENGADFLKGSPIAMISSLSMRDQGVTVGVSSTKWNVEVELDWNQIAGLVNDANEKGAVRRDRARGAVYVEPELRPNER